LDFQRGGQHTHIQFFKGMDQQLYVSADSLRSLLNDHFGEKFQTKTITRNTEITQFSLSRHLNGRSVWFLSRSAWLLMIKHTTMADRNFLALLQLDLFHDIQDYLKGNPHPPGVLPLPRAGAPAPHNPVLPPGPPLGMPSNPGAQPPHPKREKHDSGIVCTQNKARSQFFCES